MTIHKHPKFHNFHEVNHPLILHKLSLLRQKQTIKKDFKELVHEITLLLVYEVARNLPLAIQNIETPLETYQAPTLALEKNPVILPILRAGIGMVDAFLSLMPTAHVGHIGLFRNEDTLKPQQYYLKIPADSQNRKYFVCDPMLATGGSACETIDELKARGVTDTTFVCIVAAPEGATIIDKHHPEVPIFSACLDRELNEHGYILPGLGDAGDRLFGTK